MLANLKRHNLQAITISLRIALILLLTVTVKIACAQKYPVTLTATITPPYTLTLADFGKADGPLMLMANVTDVTVSNLPVYVHIKMQNMLSGEVLENTQNMAIEDRIRINGNTVETIDGSMMRMNFLPSSFTYTNLKSSQYQNTLHQLPGGQWKISAELRHLYTHRRISNIATVTMIAASGSAPQLQSIEHRTVISNQTKPITFAWEQSKLQGAGATVLYKLEIWQNPTGNWLYSYDAITQQPPYYESELTAGNFITINPEVAMLVPETKYIWRVTASEPSGNVQFYNDGKSQCREFQYLSPCTPPSDIHIDIKNSGTTTIDWATGANNNLFWVDMEDLDADNNEANYHGDVADSQVEFFELPHGSRWQVRVSASCPDGQTTEPTDWTMFRVPELVKPFDSVSCPTCGCGKEIPPPSNNQF